MVLYWVRLTIGLVRDSRGELYNILRVEKKEEAVQVCHISLVVFVTAEKIA